ncbi:MAG: LytTR family transcriptional regulator DNA-binding domain-containing protein, partial [Pseudonocardiaceae bacterium]
HRRYLVNVGRVREFERGFNGELLLITDVRDNQIVPVSRTRAKMLRRKLGM